MFEVSQSRETLVLDRRQKGEVERASLTRLGQARAAGERRIQAGIAEDRLLSVIDYLGVVRLRGFDNVVDVALVLVNEADQALTIGEGVRAAKTDEKEDEIDTQRAHLDFWRPIIDR